MTHLVVLVRNQLCLHQWILKDVGQLFSVDNKVSMEKMLSGDIRMNTKNRAESFQTSSGAEASGFVVAETSVRSTRKLFILII